MNNNLLFIDLSVWYFLVLGDRHSRASPNLLVGAISGSATIVSIDIFIKLTKLDRYLI
jgi:hypothetical protein